jgi:hypothetical protein
MVVGDDKAVQFVAMATPEDMKANAEFVTEIHSDESASDAGRESTGVVVFGIKRCWSLVVPWKFSAMFVVCWRPCTYLNKST